MIDTIIHSDYRDVAENIKEGSVDLIICDPPYGVTRNDWDMTDEQTLDELFDFFDRVKKPDAAIIVFGQQEFAARLKLREGFRYDLIFEKDRPSGFLNAKRMPLRSHEEMVVFYDELPTYNPQMWEGEENHGLGKIEGKLREVNHNYGDYLALDSRNGTLKYPRSVLSFKKPHPTIHPTQKPIELFEWLIRTYTDPGDLVLDPMCGVATTAIAAFKNDRHYICIERESDYYNKGLNYFNEKTKEHLTRKQNQEQINRFFQ